MNYIATLQNLIIDYSTTKNHLAEQLIHSSSAHDLRQSYEMCTYLEYAIDDFLRAMITADILHKRKAPTGSDLAENEDDGITHNSVYKGNVYEYFDIEEYKNVTVKFYTE